MTLRDYFMEALELTGEKVDDQELPLYEKITGLISELSDSGLFAIVFAAICAWDKYREENPITFVELPEE